MAASNYYGYTHGATAQQYGIQQPPTYSHQTTSSYSTQHVPTVAQTANYAPPAAQNPQPVASQTYQPYPTHTAPDYSSYSQQDTAPQPTSTPQNYQVYSHEENYNYGQQLTVSTYDNKQYYQTNVAPAQRTSAEAYYQPGVRNTYRPVNTAYSQPPPPQVQNTVVKAPAPVSAVSTSYNAYTVSTSVQQPPTPISTYSHSSSYNTTPATSYSGVSYSSYDSSRYTSTPAYYQPAQHLGSQQNQTQHQGPSHQPPIPSHQATPAQQHPHILAKHPSSSWSSTKSNTVPGPAVTTVKKPVFYPSKVQKPKGPPKQPQLHYCDICKISCAGPQTYREHLDGQKHKKKEAALKSGTQTTNGPHNVPTQLRCELCDIACTGADAYKAHIRGAKHLKVVKLHTKLGKPIPSTEPVLVNSPSAPVTTLAKSSTPAVVSAPPAASQQLVSNPPKMQSSAKSAHEKPVIPAKAAASVSVKVEEVRQVVMKPEPQSDEEGDGAASQGDIQPVGNDYVEEIRNDDGKLIRFHCKLCECSFNDPNAKDMHLKGRRHRLQYKKKVNPDLIVEIKPNNRARKLLETKLKKQKVVFHRQHEDEQRWHIDMSRRYEEDMYWRKAEKEQQYWEEQWCRIGSMPVPAGPGMPVPPLLPLRRPDSPDDRLIMTKHAAIYPLDEELEAVQRIVSHSERALKQVSDLLLEQDAKCATAKQADTETRVLKGVMRVGVLAKGLLLHNDKNVQLILLAAKKPTVTLLNNIAQLLPKQLRTFSEDQYVVQAQPEEASIVIISSMEPKMQVTICLTSPVMREEPAAGAEEKAGDKLPEKVPDKNPSDVLNRTKCLEYLAALRHAKWFQARANGLQSCVIIIRILRDLRQRVPTWTQMPDWPMELLVEKVISSVSVPLSPGEAMRRVLECIASGMLLQDGLAVSDPCEKGQTDALGPMSRQAREDVTASAQHALRLLAFHQIHKVLGMDTLPKSKAVPCNRKRRSDAEDESVGKKEKKEF